MDLLLQFPLDLPALLVLAVLLILPHLLHHQRLPDRLVPQHRLLLDLPVPLALVDLLLLLPLQCPEGPVVQSVQ